MPVDDRSGVRSYELGGHTHSHILMHLPLRTPPHLQDQLRLLCPGRLGRAVCEPVDNWRECAYADAPGHAFVGRPGWGAGAEGRAAIEGLLMAAQVRRGRGAAAADVL